MFTAPSPCADASLPPKMAWRRTREAKTGSLPAVPAAFPQDKLVRDPGESASRGCHGGSDRLIAESAPNFRRRDSAKFQLIGGAGTARTSTVSGCGADAMIVHHLGD